MNILPLLKLTLFPSHDRDFIKYLHSIGETEEHMLESGITIKYLELLFLFCINRNCNNWRKAHGLPLRRKGLSRRRQRNGKYKYLCLDEAHLLFSQTDYSKAQLYMLDRGSKILRSKISDVNVAQ